MATPDRVRFTISTPRTVSDETWDTFAEKTRAEGSDPKGILRRLIEYYIAKGLPHDTAPEKSE